MKLNSMLPPLSVLFAGTLYAQQGLYSIGVDTVEPMPLKWVVGASVVYDDNVSAGSGAAKEESFGLNPYVSASLVDISPQASWDVFVRLGLIYYFDTPSNIDDVNSQSRLGVNFTHRFSERLRFVSRNFVSYELEPDYSYGYASARTAGEYFFWATDNSVGYRWSERFGTYTGLRLSGTNYVDVSNNDRLSWQVYNQFRYQLTPQTVLTADYRYAQTSGDGLSSDSADQFVLVGLEHRFSPNTVGTFGVGSQFRDVEDGGSPISPYLEIALNSRLTEQFSARAFARYGMESYDTVQFVPGFGLVEYDSRGTLRFGVTAQYIVSPMFNVFAGVDYIPTAFDNGRSLESPPFFNVPDLDEDVINAFIGFSVRFNNYLVGTLSYNFTDSISDLAIRDYQRNRISVGITAEF